MNKVLLLLLFLLYYVFGIRKNKTDSCQYLPKVIVNAQRIPAVPLEESFDYLGKSFNYKMNTGPVEYPCVMT